MQRIKGETKGTDTPLSFCLSAESRPHRVKIANLNSLARTQMNTFNFTFSKAGLMLGWGSPVCSFALTCFSCWLWKCLSWHCPLDQSRLRNRSFPNCHFHISPWPELLYDLIIRIPLGLAVIPAPLVVLHVWKMRCCTNSELLWRKGINSQALSFDWGI